MRKFLDPRWALILGFLGIIAGVPAIQALREALFEEGVRVIDAFPRSLAASQLRTYEHTLENANWVANSTRPWPQYLQFRWLRDGGSKVIIGTDGWYFYKPGFIDMLARRETAAMGSLTNDPVAAITDFRDQLARHGIRLVVMPVPNKESVYPDRVTPRAGNLRGALAPRTQSLLRRLREADVACIDLFEIFSQARHPSDAESPSRLYLKQDTHWSPTGVKLAAPAAAHELTNRGWIQRGQHPYDERPQSVQRLGDILRMLQIPAVERQIPPETVDCFQVIDRKTGEPFRELPEAEILILGDSFTRIYQQDEPGSAGFAAHLARELGQPVQLLVNDGGGSTLVRQELAARPAYLARKKVLLWEFVERDLGLGREGWKLVALPPLAEDQRVSAPPR
ncbi:MAG: hypothetical protein IT581_15485 [Verrucomicrobiales bacterium]|nr:hypothetical protein [Verrucomicrobiales bacterium]